MFLLVHGILKFEFYYSDENSSLSWFLIEKTLKLCNCVIIVGRDEFDNVSTKPRGKWGKIFYYSFVIIVVVSFQIESELFQPPAFHSRL